MSKLDLFLPMPPETGLRPARVVITVHRSVVGEDGEGIGKTATHIRRWEKAIDDAIAHRRQPGGVVSIRCNGRPGPTPVPGPARTVPLRPVPDPEADSHGPWRI